MNIQFLDVKTFSKLNSKGRSFRGKYLKISVYQKHPKFKQNIRGNIC